MVQTQKQAVKERIYDAALDIFCEKGYAGSTMREIADRAEIPVGLIYTYYKSKAELLDSIVEPVFELLYSYMDRPWGESWEVCFEETRQMLTRLLHFRKVIIIALDKSAGTEYEDTRDRLVKMVDAHIAGERRLVIKDFEEFHASILATCFVEGFATIARNYESQEWAERMVVFLIKQLGPKEEDFV